MSAPRRWSRGEKASLVLVLALAALARSGSLALVHDRGDQLVFAGVAAHVASSGVTGYTLRRVDYRYEPVGHGGALIRFEPGPGEGRLLRVFVAGGEKFWDAPLASQPPVYVLALLASHGALGERGDAFPLLGRDRPALARAFAERDRELAAARDRIERLPESERDAARAAFGAALDAGLADRERALARHLATNPPAGAIRAQLWATLPQIAFDLATVALLFVVGRRRSSRAGALAALAFACDPLALFAAHRVLANPLLTLLALAALVAGERERGSLAALGAGALAGLATLTKVSAVFVLPALLAARRIERRRFARSDLALVAAFAALAVPWWLYRAKVLGDPFAYDTALAHDASASSWALHTTSRSPLYYAAVLTGSPLVLAGVLAAAWAALGGVAAWQRGDRPGDLAGPLFALVVLLAAAVFPGKEARHILLAYPPLLLAATSALARFEGSLTRPVKIGIALGLAALLGAQTYFGLGLAFDVARPL